MSATHEGPWSYDLLHFDRAEFKEHAVLDQDGDLVKTFATEAEARACVDEHNKVISWKR